MLVLVDPNDSRAVRNKDNVLALYDLMINGKKSEEATTKFVSAAYIQHNPLIGDGPAALGKFFAQITRQRARARVVVHRIIAVDDYVWAHVNFLNLFNDDPNDTGIAGVDIYRMDADGKAMEHWGHIASRWRSEKLGAVDRAEHPARQPEWNVLRAGRAAGCGTSYRRNNDRAGSVICHSANRQCRGPLLAQNGRSTVIRPCPLLGVKRTSD
jgi:predicted SnoaL-like aldol condensation-catalyzing enzyme